MSRAATPAVFERYYLARQPVFDRDGGLWGYELLFRNGPDATEAVIDDQDLATLTVAVAGLMGGPIGAGDGAEGAGARSKAGSGRRILINFTERLLLSGAPRALPPGPVVVEVLETVPPTPAVVTTLAALKAEGYTIAIDDFEGRTDLDLLLDLADIIKVDLLHKDRDRIRAIYDMIRDKPALKLAEKVDDRDMLGFLRDLGFDLFQGYFFARPENLSGRKLNASQAAKLRILQRIEDPEAGPVELADSIKADPSVTYRLLRFLNSAAFAFTREIASVPHAINLLGLNRVRYWLRMVVLSDLQPGHKTPELYALSLERGRFLEELARRGPGERLFGEAPDGLFLFGMLSLLEAMLDMPLARILAELPIAAHLKAGYTDEASPFHGLLELTDALERDDPARVGELCARLNLAPGLVGRASVAATTWLAEIMGCEGGLGETC